MRLGFGLPITRLGGGATPSNPALDNVPASVESAILTQHMTFNGSDQLTGFTTDLFGNAITASVVGTPAKGPSGGYQMTEAAGRTNYVENTWPSLTTSGKTLVLCYKRNGTADDTGVFLGTSSAATYLGFAANGQTGASLQNNSCSNYTGASVSFANNANRDTIHDNFYVGTSVQCIGFRDCVLSSGLSRIGYFPSTDIACMEIEVLGWAIDATNTLASVRETITWLNTYAPS